jgi:hypothetical protein
MNEELTFVNIHGQPVNVLAKPPKEKKPRPEQRSYHRGWRVRGVARSDFDLAKTLAKNNGEDFDEENWLMNATKTNIRSKPYEVHSAAEVCRLMALKAGWLRVVIEEVKHE